jgi:hypothetical protein
MLFDAVDLGLHMWVTLEVDFVAVARLLVAINFQHEALSLFVLPEDVRVGARRFASGGRVASRLVQHDTVMAKPSRADSMPNTPADTGNCTRSSVCNNLMWVQ